jgi:alpha-amylase
MRTICLYFQVHQPFRLRRYRFFEIGSDHYYYDDYNNEAIMRRIADNCYLPTNNLMLELIEKYEGNFKLAYSITGIALEQFELYAPDVLESFKKLAKTGKVEFLAETYSHSLASLMSKEEFSDQVKAHSKKIQELFGVKPTVFRNTELIYSDRVGEMVADLGYKAILTEGAKHILGWKSPNFVYYNAINPKLKVLLKNFKLSDDIAFRFSDQAWDEWPLTADKYVSWIRNLDDKEDVVNLFMDYETFGEHQKGETGIFDFLKSIPEYVVLDSNLKFSTPSEVANEIQPVAAVHVPNPISWADEERDLTAWLGNDLQEEAFNKLYELRDLVTKVKDQEIIKDWNFLQASDHFYYMCTKFFSDGAVHSYFNPYDNPYDAFINYMNVLNDFSIRLKLLLSDEETRVSKMKHQINQKEKQLVKFKSEISKLKAKVEELKEEKSLSKPIAKKTKSSKKAASKKKATKPTRSKTTKKKTSTKNTKT